jgi:hypothetical protein
LAASAVELVRGEYDQVFHNEALSMQQTKKLNTRHVSGNFSFALVLVVLLARFVIVERNVVSGALTRMALAILK